MRGTGHNDGTALAARLRPAVWERSQNGVRPKLLVAGLVGLLLVRLGLQLLLYRSGFVALTADEFSRSLIAARWAERPVLLWHGVWPPLHTYLLGLGLWLHNDLLVLPRALSIAFGGLALLATYGLGSVLSGDARGGWLASLLLAVNPGHVWLSSTALAEGPTSALVLLALLGLVLWVRRGSWLALLGGAGALALASALRYDAWFFVAAWCVYLLLMLRRGALPRNRLPAYGLALAMPLVFPLLWMAGNALHTGNPLAFLNEVNMYKARWYAAETDWLQYPRAMLAIDPLALLALPLSIAWVVWRGATLQRAYLLLALLPLLGYLVLHSGQIEPAANSLRYLAPYLFVFYPLFAALLVQLLRHKPPLAWRAASLVLLVVLVLQSGRVFGFTNDPVAEGLAVGQRLAALRADHNGPNATAIAELSYWQFLAVRVGANDPHLLLDRPLDLAQRDAASFWLSDPAGMVDCVGARQVRYIALRSPALQQAVAAQLPVDGHEIVNGWAIYRVADKWLAAHRQATCRLYE